MMIMMMMIIIIIIIIPDVIKEQYIQIHDRLCTQLHFNLCKEVEVKLDNEHWYDLYQNQSNQDWNVR
jgi:hypothetical protein